MSSKKAKTSKGNDKEISLSVGETNKMRKDLGMKELDTASSGVKKSAPAEKDAVDKRKESARARAKKDAAELTSGKGLGDIIAEEEGSSASAWVKKVRESGVQEDNAEAARREKEAKRSGGSGSKDALKGSDVKGMKVRHDQSDLPEQGDVVMTLADQRILDKDGNIELKPDELENVRLSDEQRAKHYQNIKNQKEYDPSKTGGDILDKYDDVKEGGTGFTLGAAGAGADAGPSPAEKLEQLTKLAKENSLDAPLRYQSDFYTPEQMKEMSKFQKPPKKSKEARKGKRKAADTKDDQLPKPVKGLNAAVANADSDEEDPELYEQLSKQRRLVRSTVMGQRKKGEAALAAVSERVVEVEEEKQAEEDKKAEEAKKGEKIAMTATTEFCNVVETPLEKLETLKHESYRGSTMYKQQVQKRKGVKAGSAAGHKRKGAPKDLAMVPDEEEVVDDELIEDSLDLTASSGIAYLRARAQIGKDQDSHVYKKSDNRPLEMSTVEGDIKLEYRDDFGRVQTPKEAFRAISWKFHGKMPGKKNLERRLMRLENEVKLKSMNPIEQLPTLRALRHVQHADAKPYMVLSGANEK